MKRIVFVISPFGFGHLTRQIALKNSLLELSDDLQIVFVISERQETTFADAILTSKRVQIERIPLTPMVTMEDWNKVDVESTRESFARYWEWETQIRDDRAWERILYGADLIINDIECVHNPIASKMGIPIVNISNFTWSDILHGLELDSLAENYVSWENLSTYDIKLPFSLSCGSFSNETDVGLLVRKPDLQKVDEIRNYSPNPKILVNHTHNQHAEFLGQLVSELLSNDYTPIVPSWLINDQELKAKCIIIENDEDNTQNYYYAADLVISKLGYGTVSEILQGGTKILYWKREGFIEDDALAYPIISRNLGIELPNDASISLIVDKIEDISFTKVNSMKNETDTVATKILGYLNQE